MRVWIPVLALVVACDLVKGQTKEEPVAAADEVDADPDMKPKPKAKPKAKPKSKPTDATKISLEPKAKPPPEPVPEIEAPVPVPVPEAEARPAEVAEAAEGEGGGGLAAAGSASPRCIIGKWEAVDYRAVIDRAMNSDADLRKFSYSSSGGVLGYIVEEDGTVKQTAQNVAFRLSGKVEGFKVNATVTLDGENVADYELAEPNIIKVGKPREKNLKVKVSYAVKGITRGGKTRKLDLDFDGEFLYTCTQDKLTVVNAANDKGRPMTFKRKS